MFMMNFEMVDKLQLEDVPQIFFDLQINGVNVPVLVSKTWKYARHNNDKAAVIASLNILCNAYYQIGEIEKSEIFGDLYYKLLSEVEKMDDEDAVEIYEMID